MESPRLWDATFRDEPERTLAEYARACSSDAVIYKSTWLALYHAFERIERLGGWYTCGKCGEHGEYYFASGLCHDCEEKRVGHSVRAPY